MSVQEIPHEEAYRPPQRMLMVFSENICRNSLQYFLQDTSFKKILTAAPEAEYTSKKDWAVAQSLSDANAVPAYQ